MVLDAETKRVCIQITLGAETATQALPEHLATATEEGLRSYFEGVIPGMVDGLRAKEKLKRQTIWKKAKDV